MGMLLNETLLKTMRINVTVVKNLISKHLTPLLTVLDESTSALSLQPLKFTRKGRNSAHYYAIVLFHFIIFITAM